MVSKWSWVPSIILADFTLEYLDTNTWLQIVCQSCGHVSEREEEFLDIPVALTGRTGLQQALKEMYNDKELLEGDNKYHCSKCDRLVDARRVSHMTSTW